MSGEAVPKKKLAKATQKAIVEKYLTACSENHIRRKWMTVKAIARYINKHLPIPNVVENIEIVNQHRRVNNTYTDADAAKLINNGSDKKEPLSLEKNPFCLEFEYGATAEGYWTYDRMVLQLEDCADVLKALHPEFDIVFLFDHSCGHDRGREDGLNVSGMRLGYGGVQRVMHSREIKAEKGYLGTHHRTLNVGDVQHMVFREGDDGPFWLTPEQKLERMHSVYEDMEQKDKTKPELLEELRAKGVQAIGLRGRKVAELKALAENNGIEITKMVRKESCQHWTMHT